MVRKRTLLKSPKSSKVTLPPFTKEMWGPTETIWPLLYLRVLSFNCAAPSSLVRVRKRDGGIVCSGYHVCHGVYARSCGSAAVEGVVIRTGKESLPELRPVTSSKKDRAGAWWRAALCFAAVAFGDESGGAARGGGTAGGRSGGDCGRSGVVLRAQIFPFRR